MKTKSSAVLIIFLLIISGFNCRYDILLNYFDSKKQDDSVRSDVGQIKLLKVEPSLLTVLQSNLIDSLTSSSKLILADSGGVMKVGSAQFGFCKLKFQAGDLKKDAIITMKWRIDAGVFEVQLEPTGLAFLNSVTLEMSYKIAQIKNSEIQKLQIYYYNEQKNIWEFIGGRNDLNNRKIKVELEHFSRYAMAHSE